jgi:hypothetical protein
MRQKVAASLVHTTSMRNKLGRLTVLLGTWGQFIEYSVPLQVSVRIGPRCSIHVWRQIPIELTCDCSDTVFWNTDSLT